MGYNIINPVDINGDLMRLPEYYLTGKTGQFDSHGYTYLQSRELLQKELGQVMGIDKMVLENENRI